jgi:TolB protein
MLFMKKIFFLLNLIIVSAFSQSVDEVHLKNMKQLTFGGNNAEAYFSRNDKNISFQSDYKAWGLECDQIFTMNINKPATQKPNMISTGFGRTTCSFYMPNNKEILFASTHDAGGHACPMPPEMGKKYLWAVYETFDIYVADLKGKIKRKLTDSPGYDAEATVSPDGKKIVFTSTRNGDLDLYTMNIDGSDVRQVTFELGYDGGAFFSPDSKKLVFRASRFANEEERTEYKENLKKNLVAPTNMEIFTCNADGSDLKQITKLGKANWAPYYTPKGDKIIFASNHHSTRGYDFQLYLINTDGTGLKKITTESNFNAFPMFSYDGKKLIFSSNRNNGGTRDTNLFIADWVD